MLRLFHRRLIVWNQISLSPKSGELSNNNPEQFKRLRWPIKWNWKKFRLANNKYTKMLKSKFKCMWIHWRRISLWMIRRLILANSWKWSSRRLTFWLNTLKTKNYAGRFVKFDVFPRDKNAEKIINSLGEEILRLQRILNDEA